MWHHRAVLGAVACLAPGALGQVDGQATWLWEVTTQNGDAIVEPGETATVTLSIDFDPDANPDGPLLGFGFAFFDTLGGANAGKGEIMAWEVPGHLLELTGDTTTTDGVSLFGTTAAQHVVGVGFVYDDPIDVLSFEWGTDDFDRYSVSYETFTLFPGKGDHLMGVWVGESLDRAEEDIWPIEEAMISFQVVPAPAPPVLGVVAALLLARRRR